MFSEKVKRLLFIEAKQISATPCMAEISAFCEHSCSTSMADIETATLNPCAVLYLMDVTSSEHLYNINYIRHKYPNRLFFIVTRSLSIPLLHYALHIGVDDLFIYPLSSQDKQSLFSTLKNRACVECKCEKKTIRICSVVLFLVRRILSRLCLK